MYIIHAERSCSVYLIQSNFDFLTSNCRTVLTILYRMETYVLYAVDAVFTREMSIFLFVRFEFVWGGGGGGEQDRNATLK